MRVCPLSPERCVKRPMPATQSPTASTHGLLVCNVSLICTPAAENGGRECAVCMRRRCACRRCASGARAVRERWLCLHAISGVGHARLVEADALHVGSAPGGDQQHVALELAHLAAAAAAAAARHAHAHAPPLEGGHLLHLHAQLEGDAVGRERRVHRRRRLRVRAWQQPRAALDARDLVRVRVRVRVTVTVTVRG